MVLRIYTFPFLLSVHISHLQGVHVNASVRQSLYACLCTPSVVCLHPSSADNTPVTDQMTERRIGTKPNNRRTDNIAALSFSRSEFCIEDFVPYLAFLQNIFFCIILEKYTTNELLMMNREFSHPLKIVLNVN